MVCYSIKIATLGAIAIISVNLALLFVFTRIGGIFMALAGVGIVTFLGVLALADYVSIEPSVSTGEMRSAIASSIVVLYLVVIALTFSGQVPAETAIATTLINNFTWVVGIVVVFYFGSKGVLQYIELTKDVKAKTKELTDAKNQLEELKKSSSSASQTVKS